MHTHTISSMKSKSWSPLFSLLIWHAPTYLPTSGSSRSYPVERSPLFWSFIIHRWRGERGNHHLHHAQRLSQQEEDVNGAASVSFPATRRVRLVPCNFLWVLRRAMKVRRWSLLIILRSCRSKPKCRAKPMPMPARWEYCFLFWH